MKVDMYEKAAHVDLQSICQSVSCEVFIFFKHKMLIVGQILSLILYKDIELNPSHTPTRGMYCYQSTTVSFEFQFLRNINAYIT